MTNVTSGSERAAESVFLIDQAMSFAYPAALRAAAVVGVADHLVEGPKTLEELAAATKTDAQKLHRVLRLLTTRGVFREDEKGRFRLTPSAEQLRRDVPMSARQAVIMLTSKQHWVPLEELAECLRSDRPSFNHIFGTSIWEYRGTDLSPDEEFHLGMSLMSEAEVQSPIGLYDFPKGATVVDVGGGVGAVLLTVLRKDPSLRGILFDQEYVLAKNRLTELEDDDRWELKAGDFFKECPEGDVYLLKYITHDWDDESAIRILRNCREAMRPGGRVLVFETVIPRESVHHTGKFMDMLVMGIYPGRERTEEDFRKLLASAGLRLTRVVEGDSHVGIVEAVAA